MDLVKNKDFKVKIQIIKNMEPLDSVISLKSLVLNIKDILDELLVCSSWKIREETIKNFKIIFLKINDETIQKLNLLKCLEDKLSDRV